jgi:type III secretion protein V
MRRRKMYGLYLVLVPMRSRLPVLNLATGDLCCVTNVKHQQSLEPAGLKFCHAFGYLILLLKRELTINAWRLLDCEAVEIELARLHKELPALVLAAIDRQSPLRLSRILKILLREEISIKNLRAILERVVSYDYIVTDVIKPEVDRYIILDDRLTLYSPLDPKLLNGADLRAQHVREGLKENIRCKFIANKKRPVLYTLDPVFERGALDHLAGKSGLHSDQIGNIRNALRSKVRSAPSSVNPMAILTHSPLRLFVRRLIEDEFPNIPVLAYEELSPDMQQSPEIKPLSSLGSVG